MKNFRNKLHFMFLDPEMSERQKYYPSSDLEKKDQETKSVEKATQKEKEEVREDVIQHPEFSNVAGNVASEVASKYTDMEQLKKDRTRFQERLKSKSDNEKGEEYVKVWEQKIRKGFDNLIKALEENKYFDDCKDNEAKNKKIADIMIKYSKEVHTQYEKYIWSAENKTFNRLKDNIFSSQSTEYPVEKVYKELTGATTISKVDRTYVEGYEADILDWTDTEDKNESMSDRKFLSDDLPQYLWDIRKTPGVLNVLKWLPIFSVKEDRPSKVDRKAIKQFLKTSSKINVEGDKDKAVALMEALHDNRLNTNSGETDYENVLKDYKITVDKKYLDDIVKAGAFYINTQRTDNDVRDQHAIYLSILKIIESEGSVDKAVRKFEAIVEQGKKDKKNEKKERYESGELLDKDTRNFVEKLGITDFGSATRLIKKDVKYFKGTPVEKILANLNNDRTIDARDVMAGGTKSGAQFLEIFNQVGEDKALTNLLEHAKLMNKTLGLDLDESRFKKERIQYGDFNLILLLQNIISKPGEDLYTLLSGHPENPFEGIDLAKEDAASKKYAAEMIKKMDLEALKKDGLTLPTPESMQSGLATALYTEYKRGIGLGGKVSFDQWVKGVEMNTGFQVRDDGTVMVGVGLNYRTKFNLRKGWSTTPEFSAGAFIPLGMGNFELSGSIGINDEVAKERITKKGIKQHLGVQGGITLMPAGVYVVSGGLKWERNKAAGIEESPEQKKMVEFRDNIISPILNRIYEERIKTQTATKLNFNDPSLVKSIKSVILAKAIDEKIPGDKREMVTNAVMRLLLNYKDANLAQEGVRDIIAQGMAEQYAMAWAEDRKAHISDKAYLSGANLGAFWVVGSPLVGIYAGVKFTKHDLDGYGDRWGDGQEIAQEYQGEWNQKMLDRFNQQLGLSGDKQIKIANGFVVIPSSIKHRVNVNEKMYGLMMKDKNGNILLHTQTPMATDVKKGAATQGGEIIIGGIKGGQYVKLDTIGPDQFVDNKINEDEILKLGEGLTEYNLDVLNKAIDNLNNKLGKNLIQHLGPDAPTVELITKLNEINKNKKKAKITIIDNNGKIEFQPPVEGEDGRGLELKYESTFEMIDSVAGKIADDVYAEALKVKDPKVLNDVKHMPRPEWTELETAYDNLIKNGLGEGNVNEKTVKEKVRNIFKKLDEQIRGAKFSDTLNNENRFEGLTGDALVQALMSIKNIFARSKQVRGGNGVYEFKQPETRAPKEMKAIIEERYKIYDTLKGRNDIDEQAKARYRELFDATRKYVKDNKDFAVKSAEAASLGNTVGFNLGDKKNPENPLFNPEIYDKKVDLDILEKDYGLTKKAREGLHKRSMSKFAKNPALINPVLQAVGIDTSNLKLENMINEEKMTINPKTKKCELELDIGSKKYKLETGMEFGFFTQCVNHLIMLTDITITSEDGTSVKFNSSVMENGTYREGNRSSIVSTTEVGASVSVVVSKPKSEPEEEPKGDATTNPTETEEDIPKQNSDETSKTGADDNGKVNTGEGTPVGGEGNSDHQGGGRPSGNGEGEGDTPPTGDEGSTDEWELEPDRN